MPIYRCPRCGHISNQKGDMKKHLKRKKICPPTCSNMSIPDCFQALFGSDEKNFLKNDLPISVNLRNFLNDHSNDTQMTPNDTQMTPKYTQMTPSECNIKKFMCPHCKYNFLHKRSLKRHLDKGCKKIINTEVATELSIKLSEATKMIEELKEQNKKLTQGSLSPLSHAKITNNNNNTTNNTTNNTNCSTNNTYIVVNAFGNENISYIKEKIVQDLLKAPYTSIPKLLKRIHFDPKHKENCNVKITNKKEPIAQIFNGEKWEYRDKKETINSMTDKAYDIINNHYKDGTNKYADNFKDDYENSDAAKKDIKKKTEFLIMNESKND